jgi:16S rRNA (cytosine967-C5)-methyltransferase
VPVDIVRDTAVTVLLRVFGEPVHIADALDRALRRRGERLSPRGKRFLTQLVYGTVRHAALADHVLAPLLHQSLDSLPPPIRTILRMGVFQSLFLHTVTTPAMVHTSVDLAKKHGHAGTARLVNAVLKRVPASLEEVPLPDRETDLAGFLATRYSIPRWIVDRWMKDFGAETASNLCSTSSEEAPRAIRVNTLKASRDELVERLKKAEIAAKPDARIPELIEIVDGPLPIEHKSFREGAFYVQDGASMLPVHLLAPEAGTRIADLCAAPGGKSTHLAALTGDNALIAACDADPRRMMRMRENCERLGTHSVRLAAADANAAPFRTGTFDAVLLDAPCTGLGTLRRRPDLKWRLQPDAPARLAAVQQRLLRSAIALCKNGGSIVYSVCTFTPEETLGVLESIKGDGEVSFEDGPPWMDSWKVNAGQYRVLPSAGGLDGYFLTRLRKRS